MMKTLNHLGDENILKNKSVNPENEMKSTNIQDMFNINNENERNLQDSNNTTQPR